MIRMIQSTSSGHAKTYFSQALQKADYYLNDQELQGRFLGRLGERIGVTGATTKEDFFALCENINPRTGNNLTPRTREDRRVGYDINFHCPKSVSVVHVLSKDQHIMEAFQSSVYDTMKEIEADAMTRVRKNRSFEDRATDELLWADFTHQTARPVGDHLPDPHLHSHCFVFNATWDNEEQIIKAGEFGNIKRDMPYYQARFHKRLSDKLIDLGYDIRRTDKSFEIAGVPQGVIDLFSKRTNEIGEFAKEKGITGAKELSELGARTRSKKQSGLSMQELQQEWRRQIRESVPYKPGEAEMPVRFAPKKEQELEKEKDQKQTQKQKETSADCVEHALNHCFERASVMAERRILAPAYRHSIGHRHITLDGITGHFKSDGRIIHVVENNRTLCTTKEVLLEEKHMVALARKGQGKFRPLYNIVPELKSDGQQADAIAHLLTTKHGVSIVRGAAGSGKTTMLKELVPLLNKAGQQVTLVAQSTDASRGVLVKEGFKDATTVADLLTNKELQDKLQGQTLIVDEAGLLGTREMSAILELGQKQNARVILVGDTRQHSSVLRGDALRILNTVGGIKTAEISKIYRQKNFEYRNAVENLSKGDVKSAFEKLDGIGSIKEIDPLKPNEDLVADYINAVKNKKSVLIVSPMHNQGDEVTDLVRKKLRSAGLIGKKELTATRYRNLNYTEAEKSDWRNFKQGQVVQFNQNVPKIKRGSIWQIEDANEKQITLANAQGEKQLLPQDKAKSFDLFRKEEIGLSKGDKIRITKNGFDEQEKRLNNGHALEVVSVNKSGSIKLINKDSKIVYHLDKDFGHITHDYCSTSHSSQGKTVDEVFISQPAATFPATDAKQFYVSVSRGRDKATIYTDDKEELLEHAKRIGDRKSAMELVKGNNLHLDYVQQLERNKAYSKEHKPSKNIELYTNLNHIDYEPEF